MLLKTRLWCCRHRCEAEKVASRTVQVKWGGGFTTRCLKQRQHATWENTYGLALFLPLCRFPNSFFVSIIWHSTPIAQSLMDITVCPALLLLHFYIHTCLICSEAQVKACQECPAPPLALYLHFSCIIFLYNCFCTQWRMALQSVFL